MYHHIYLIVGLILIAGTQFTSEGVIQFFLCSLGAILMIVDMAINSDRISNGG